MARNRGLAIVTGSSSGIGEATARALARRGFPTVLVARRSGRLEELADELGRHAPSLPLPLDLSREAEVAPRLAEVTARAGPVDALVNCAGHGQYETFLETEPDTLHALMQVHYFGPAAAIRSVLPSMRARGTGHVVNVASISTKMGPWGHSGYVAAKSALTALTESLAAEYGPAGVRFSVVHPGLVDTAYFRRTELEALRGRVERRLVPPERVARAVVRLLDRPRLQRCVPRHYRVLDLLGAVSPELLHRLVRRQSTPRHASRAGEATTRGPGDGGPGDDGPGDGGPGTGGPGSRAPGTGGPTTRDRDAPGDGRAAPGARS
ncbi:SDR family oxidoreductase [Streptomyces sp. JJ36]|uniref:SDR family NAD(P)-dependent oxidoreductase n=1 Tax=Streptomyces sp. JJ36 TaxID=2736645 RepID=UPI001F25992B|nr:SDR family oxidoreductase [Streptomyces sp. JJ36]MCF6521996.1 SDR family oxidoreductase [Streptomyces sp. JJ36]